MGGVGVGLISLGLIGYQMHTYLHHIIFAIGNILVILIYLPWHIKSISDKPSKFNQLFLSIIIVYVILLLINGIFLHWPMTFEDVIMSTK